MGLISYSSLPMAPTHFFLCQNKTFGGAIQMVNGVTFYDVHYHLHIFLGDGLKDHLDLNL